MAMPELALDRLICSPSLLGTLSDAELMNALSRGCNDALAVLFERYSALVFRIARTILRDDGEAEETVQRVFIDIFRAVGRFNPDRGSFKTWLLQYAYHRTINRREHLQASHFYNCEELDETTSTDLFYGTGHLLRLPPQDVAYLVEQVLSLLEPHQRRVVELTYFEGLTATEVAKATGNSPSSVRNNLYRGLAKLRSAILEKCETKTTAAFERRTNAEGMLVEQPRTL
jgi:RNA polymerase sigma-70 factor (ECF subfamily)